MTRNKKNIQKTYCSITEVENDFFPKSVSLRLVKKQKKDPTTYGTELATELLQEATQQLKAN